MEILRRCRGAAPALLGVAALAAVLGACSSGDRSSADSETSTTTSTASSTTTTTTTPVPGADAVAAYRAFWDDFLAAGDPIDPLSARLEAHATGEQLKSVRNSFLAVKAAGHVIRGSFSLAPRVVSVAADTVILSDCYDDHTGAYSADGVRQDKEDPRRHLVTATVTLVDGAWKVAAIKHEGDGCTAS
jgi:hypothetical protein